MSIPSLGDEKSVEFRLVREEHAMPEGGRPALISKFAELVNKGNAQRVLVQVGRPIIVHRAVPKEAELPPAELPPDDLFLAAMNNSIEDVGGDRDWTPLRYFVTVFNTVDQRKLKARKLYIANYQQMQRWVGFGWMSPSFLGIEVGISKDVPEDAVVLVASGYDEWDLSTAIAFRIPVDLPIKKEKRK